jgi:nitrogen fixation NifU-like protein
MMYSDLVMDHFSAPRNVGEVEDPDGVGEIGNPVCGDVMRLTIKVRDGRIADVKFKTFGCGAAVATSSMVTEMVKGATLDEALAVSNKAVAEALGGLPPQKMHCSNLAADALHLAIEDYLVRHDDEHRDRAAATLGRRRDDAAADVSGGAAELCTLAFDDDPGEGAARDGASDAGAAGSDPGQGEVAGDRAGHAEAAGDGPGEAEAACDPTGES